MIQFDNFDQKKIELLKNHLTAQASKGKALLYEIYVDGLKAVPKTDEPSEFDGYESYLAADTYQVKIIIYSATSHRNDQYVFVMQARNREEAMNMGLNGFASQGFTNNSLNEWRQAQQKSEAQSYELAAVKKENEQLKKQLKDAEEYADTLADVVETAKANSNKIGGVHWGEVMSVALEGLLRRNTHLIRQIPAVSGLAGIIEKDNELMGSVGITPQPTTEASFKKKEDVPMLSEEEKEFVALFHQLQQYFDETELTQVIGILDALSKDKSLLQPVAELVQDN